jgi:hypothetical protein
VVGGTLICLPVYYLISFFSARYGLAARLPLENALVNHTRAGKLRFRGGNMQMAITFMAVVGGMIFSLAVALLAEELIFGQLFRLFFATGKLAGEPVAKPELKH